jgi:glycosyltransferase involved in cell wall biosynthesis
VICQGENGWIAPDQTPQAYQAIIQAAAEDPERLRVIGGNAARTIRESYSIDRMVVQFAELYRRLLGL